MAPDTIIVVPCYNEESRLDVDTFGAFCSEHTDLKFLFVNDGSTDGTLSVLENFSQNNPNASVLDLQPNSGKAEAVRRGFLEAFEKSPDYVGFWDADLATPLGTITQLISVLQENRNKEMVFGSRVQLLGKNIERHASRHYLGRFVATLISLSLDMKVYDTQCGAKLFRASDKVKALFAEPFISNWVFDVEIIARFIKSREKNGLTPARDAIIEYPLDQWRDIDGSKVSFTGGLKALVDIARIRLRYF